MKSLKAKLHHFDHQFQHRLHNLYHGMKFFGPLSYPLFLFAFCYVLYFAFRLVLTLLYWNRIAQEPHFYHLFFIGLRIDGIITCYLLGLPTLLFVLLPQRALSFLRHPLAIFCALIVGIAVSMEISTIPFMAEYDLRPDRIFFEYLKYPQEVFGTILKERPLFLLATILGLGLFFRAFWHLGLYAIKSYSPWNWWKRLLITPLVAALIFLGARSSLGHRPANISTAFFSNNNLVNEITLNSSYSLFYAIYRTRHEHAPTKVYGKMSLEDAVKGVKQSLFIPPENYIDSKIPFYHSQPAAIKRKRPLNVVIFLQESMGAEFTGVLGGSPLTPHLDKLAQEGLLFTQLYATGSRTVRGIEATAAGFLPTPGTSVVKLGLARRNFFTAGLLFKKYDYNTMFIYGGMSNFDEMRSFFMGNGFEEIYDEPTFENPILKGTWGVSDLDLVIKANDIFKKQQKPFFALMLSTTNHSPFEFPDGHIELYEQPKETMHNALKFADYSIGKLIELAKKEDYFKDTLFLIQADHNTRVYGDAFVPVHKFHIPGVLLGPDVPIKRYDKICSQIDMLPTLLHFAGIDTKHPMIGHDLFSLPDSYPGRAIMQYGDNHGYMLGDQVVIHRPYSEPMQFQYDFKKKELTSTPRPLDPKLEQEGLSYAMLPWELYKDQLYTLPKE